jgi:type VI secretion system protein VasG
VHEIFFQVFDKGFMEDGEGRFIDFKNTLILLTTNAGTDLIEPVQGPRPDARPRGHGQGAARAAAEGLPAGAAGPAGDDPYYPLSDEMLGKHRQAAAQPHQEAGRGALQDPLRYGDDVVKLVVSRCTESESGGRMIDAILTNTVMAGKSSQRLQDISVQKGARHHCRRVGKIWFYFAEQA